MSTWHRTDDRGIPVAFTYTPDQRGSITLTVQEVEGLMRTGGWKPGPLPQALTFEQRLTDMARAVGGLPPATWKDADDLGRMSIEAHARQQEETP